MPSKQANSPYWYISYTNPATGRKVRKSSGTRLKREALELEVKLRRQIQAVENNPQSRSFKEIAVPYLEHCELTQSAVNYSRIQSRFRGLARFFGNRRHDELTPELISYYKTNRGVQPGTLRREMDEYVAAINYVNKAYGWGLNDPFKGIKPPQPAGRRRWLRRDEAQRLIAAAATLPRAKEYLPDYIRLRLLTGMRPGELAALRWDKIDYDREVIDLHPEDQKNREFGLIPLAPQAIAILKSRQTHKNPTYVFQVGDSHLKRIHKSFRAACAKAGIEDFKPHDLRHTTASWVLNDGNYSLREVGGVLRHKDPQSTNRYAHLAPENIAKAINAVGDV